MKWVLLLLCLACWPVCGSARADDWGVKRDPFDPVVIARYKAMLARDPYDPGLQPLVAMYKGYRTVAKLETEYRDQLAAKPDDWATLVVLARLPRSARADTLALWKRALDANPKDGRGWFAFGKLASDAAVARDAFRKAVDHAAGPRDKKLALVELVGAARRASDALAVDAAYVELIALDPKDANLWLDRGNAQLAANTLVSALESFVKAESLFTTDPERRLTALISQGIALERLGRIDDAIARWVQTLDKAPQGSYLRREIVPRIIEAERKRQKLSSAIALLEKRWPEARRGYYEWDVLGDLYKENREDERALAAYRKSVAKAPTEITTQRKLIAMLDQLGPADEALRQHEAAAKLAPGDPNLQIDLAKRYYAHDRDKAFATLDRVAKRMSKDPGVRQALAELYTSWDERGKAILEYEALADLEPKDQEHVVILGEAYWRAGQRPRAIVAWQRLARIGTAAAYLRQAEILSLHGVWADAAAAFTESLARDATQVEAWRGRARAHDELRQFSVAVADAKRAVALIGNVPDDAGHRVRFQLVRALDRWRGSGGAGNIEQQHLLARWRFAFDRGDVGAGYLLLAHHARIQSHQQHDVLVQLYKRVPTDDAVGLALARSYARRKEYAIAKRELELIAKRWPKRAEEVGHLLVQLEIDRARDEQNAIWDEEGLSERERGRRRAGKQPSGLLDRRRRIGLRFGVGADVRGTSSAQLGLGLYHASRFNPGSAIETRLDWSQRDDEAEEVNAFAVAVAFVQRLPSTRRFELGLAVGPRFELRYGSDLDVSSWGRAGLGLDAALQVVPRALSATLGLRVNQAITDATRGTAVIAELAFEVR
jgi:tetratricopeptide (TPR) repeat protein